MPSIKRISSILLFSVFVVLYLLNPVFGAERKAAPIQMELPQPDIPKPQFFCGYCHILTYPSVVKKGHDTWQKGKHQKYGCVECHYPPTAAEGRGMASRAGAGGTHIPKKGMDRFAYLQLGGETVKTRPRITDASCMTGNCHGNPDDKFKTKEIKFLEKVRYVHQPHFEKKNQIEGQNVTCTSCHQHSSEKKHFEVSKESCFLCHFKNTKFAEGRSKCTLCHKLPEKPIQTSGEKPITHKMLQDAKVECGGCHYDLLKGGSQVKYALSMEGGEIRNAQIMGGGEIKKESCSGCHDQERYLKEAVNGKLMHEGHVTKQTARCFDCHGVIAHKKADAEKPIEIRSGCSACHPDHHKYQELLMKGVKREGISKTPDPMFKAQTNCLGCHVERGVDKKGEGTLKATGKACVKCHTKEHDKMLDDWVKELTKEVKSAQELETEAKEVIAEFEGKKSKEKLDEAREMLREGQGNLRIVENGNGVHNKKYSMMLIDAAMTNFEDLIDELEEGN